MLWGGVGGEAAPAATRPRLIVKPCNAAGRASLAAAIAHWGGAHGAHPPARRPVWFGGTGGGNNALTFMPPRGRNVRSKLC